MSCILATLEAWHFSYCGFHFRLLFTFLYVHHSTANWFSLSHSPVIERKTKREKQMEIYMIRKSAAKNI